MAEQLYYAWLDVGYTARRCKMPGPLSQTMIATARGWLRIREDEQTVVRFALSMSPYIRAMLRASDQLPEPFVDACWRLNRLLECVRSAVSRNRTTVTPNG